MKLDPFIEERRPSWAELEALLKDARGRPWRLGPARVRRLGELYRGAAADLATARQKAPSDPAVPALEDLVRRAHSAVYGQGVRRESALGFLSRGYWRRVRQRPLLLLVAGLLLLAPAGLGAAWAAGDPGAAAGLVPGATRRVAEPRHKGAHLGLPAGERTAFAAAIFTNNIKVSFLAAAGGIAAGLLTAAVLVFNGLTNGVVGGLAVAGGNADVFVQLVVPHGLLELSCIVVAGAAGLRMGWAVVDPGRRPRSQALRTEARAAMEMVLGTALWLVVAGLVEGLLTPVGIGVGPALAVGLGLAALFWSLVWWRGRPPAAATPA
ncbi:MAG: stage II sporulation protein M [Actinobacteria bacterium]|nr:stage II sporulation protein M [Actinomycetota bacterium]